MPMTLPTTRSLARVAVLMGALTSACGDGDGGSPAAGGTVTPDQGPRGGSPALDDARPATGGATDLGLVDLGGPVVGDATPDAAPPCSPDLRGCVEPGGPAVVVCGEDGRTAVELCPEGTVCLGGEGRCLPDPATCVPDTRICLDGRTPARCVAGEGWVAEAACADGGGCSGPGECVSAACAVAEERRSYQGCAFLATDLPNAAWWPGGGTPEAPLGVVVANPRADAPLRVTARDAAGALAALVAEIRITPPVLFAQVPPATVATEIRDAAGAVTSRAFDRAENLEVPPGGLAVLLFPNRGTTEVSRIGRHAWHVTTTEPAVAYQFGPYCCNYSFSNDASLLLPVGALGTDYVNVGVPSWADRPTPEFEDPQGLPATLTLIGTQEATQVTIELPRGAGVLPVPGGLGAGVRVDAAAGRVEATLGRGEVLDLLSDPPQIRGADEDPIGVDLSGARVRSSAPVAVFTGHTCSFYPQSQGACDHLEEQLFPVETWGDRYLLTPTKLRTQAPQLATEATFWKFVAAEETRITLSVPLEALEPSPPGFLGVRDCAGLIEGDGRSFTLAPGAVCEFGSRAAFGVSGDRPFSVLGVMSGEASTGLLPGGEAGDPAIFLPPPERQLRFTYSFLTPATYHSDYVTIVAPVGANIELDGAPVDLARGERVLGEDWVYVHAPLADGPHQITGDQRTGIVVYAYDDWVSYAFTGGLDLVKR